MADFRPGAWRCAKCNLRLVKTAFYVATGAIGPDDDPEKCPNDCGPMWRVTREQDCKEAERWGEEQFDRTHSLAMMIRMLCSYGNTPSMKEKAMALLRKFDLQGSPLRDASGVQASHGEPK